MKYLQVLSLAVLALTCHAASARCTIKYNICPGDKVIGPNYSSGTATVVGVTTDGLEVEISGDSPIMKYVPNSIYGYDEVFLTKGTFEGISIGREVKPKGLFVGYATVVGYNPAKQLFTLDPSKVGFYSDYKRNEFRVFNR